MWWKEVSAERGSSITNCGSNTYFLKLCKDKWPCERPAESLPVLRTRVPPVSGPVISTAQPSLHRHDQTYQNQPGDITWINSPCVDYWQHHPIKEGKELAKTFNCPHSKISTLQWNHRSWLWAKQWQIHWGGNQNTFLLCEVNVFKAYCVL